MWFVPLVRRRVAAWCGLRIIRVDPHRDRSTIWYDDRGGHYVASSVDWDAPRWWAGPADVARLCHEIGHILACRVLPPVLAHAKLALQSGSVPSPEGDAAVLEDEVRAWEEGWAVAAALGVSIGAYRKEMEKCFATHVVATLRRQVALPTVVVGFLDRCGKL